MIEEWLPVDDCDGYYAVSSYGRVMNMLTDKILTPRKTRTGYLRVALMVNGKRVDKYVHRLVADAFYGHPDDQNVVNHLDSNPANNAVDNLEWTTQHGNVIYAMKQGRIKEFPNAIAVVGMKDGKEYHFQSSQEAERKTGCYHKSIIKCCRHKMKQTHGYKWEYEEVS